MLLLYKHSYFIFIQILMKISKQYVIFDDCFNAFIKNEK